MKLKMSNTTKGPVSLTKHYKKTAALAELFSRPGPDFTDHLTWTNSTWGQVFDEVLAAIMTKPNMNVT